MARHTIFAQKEIHLDSEEISMTVDPTKPLTLNGVSVLTEASRGNMVFLGASNLPTLSSTQYNFNWSVGEFGSSDWKCTVLPSAAPTGGSQFRLPPGVYLVELSSTIDNIGTVWTAIEREVSPSAGDNVVSTNGVSNLPGITEQRRHSFIIQHSVETGYIFRVNSKRINEMLPSQFVTPRCKIVRL